MASVLDKNSLNTLKYANIHGWELIPFDISICFVFTIRDPPEISIKSASEAAEPANRKNPVTKLRSRPNPGFTPTF